MLTKSAIVLSLALCKAVAAATIFRPDSTNQQSTFARPPLSPFTESGDPNKVPGHNNGTYGPVPEAKQLFKLEYLEVTPTPIPVYAQA